MLVSDSRKFIFIHIPRTAGISVTQALTPFADGADLDFSQMPWEKEYPHYTAEEIARIVGEERFRGYFKFAFVRNPWERMVSRYFYLRKFNDRGDQPINMRNYYAPGSLSFSEWLTGTSQNAVHPLDMRRQRDWLIRGEAWAADLIGRFENLAQAIDTVNTMLNLDIVLPHENRSDHTGYREYYDDSTRDFVAQRFAADIETWGYAF